MMQQSYFIKISQQNVYDAIILKDLRNAKKKNSADFENSCVAKNRFDGFDSPWRDPFFKSSRPIL